MADWLDADPILVTGMGCLAAGARGPEALYATAVSGRSPAHWVEVGSPERPKAVAACRVPDPDVSDPNLRPARKLDRTARLALSAARDAWMDAGLDAAGCPPERLGVIVGSGRGPLARALEIAIQHDAGSVPPSASSDSTPGSLSGVISQSLSALGPGSTVAATCSSGAVAIGTAAMHLLVGDADAMLAGGTEAPILPLMVDQLGAAGVLGYDPDPAHTCRPFDVRRNGIVVGEGAAFIVLERASSATQRGARGLARLAGWAVGSDAGGRTSVTPGGDGLVRLIEKALAMARLEPRDIGYVNAHGTGTRVNDSAEAQALGRVFRSCPPPVSSTKPVTGHCLGATPAMEAILAVQALRNGCLPPTANLQERDPACDLDVIEGRARAVRPRAVLSTSLGFWGMLAALIFTEADS